MENTTHLARTHGDDAGDPCAPWGALELQAFLTLGMLIPIAILSVALSVVTVAELTGNKN